MQLQYGQFALLRPLQNGDITTVWRLEMRSLAILIGKNKMPSEKQAKQMMDLCKIATPYGFLADGQNIIGIFSCHNRNTGVISIIHSDELKLSDNLNDYQLYLVLDTTVMKYDENNISKLTLSHAQHEQIINYLEGV